MRKILQILLIFIGVVFAAGCGPSRHAIHVEMRHPSRSGLELGGKMIAVAYSCTGNATADHINAGMAAAFAKALETDYGTGKGSVGVYRVDGTKGDYSQRDSLIKILMKAGADMAFLFGPLQVKSDGNGAVPVKVNLYCYDGMNKEDKVFAFTGNTVISLTNDKKALTDEASDAGKLVAEPFEAQWMHEQYSIAYYDNMKWYEALVRAEQYDWKGAMDIWLDCLNTNDMLKRASAEYNIAVACYMLGDIALAEEWLNRSVADNEMPTLTDALRKRIEARK